MNEAWSRFRPRPHIFNLDKIREATAGSWGVRGAGTPGARVLGCCQSRSPFRPNDALVSQPRPDLAARRLPLHVLRSLQAGPRPIVVTGSLDGTIRALERLSGADGPMAGLFKT